MADRNWDMIRSGETFEGLVSTLVFFEDHRAVLFGRRGKDGGQDVLSADGKTVYQAKYHQDQSASKAISDAKLELEKIAEYKKQEHPRYDQWKNVENWKLVTNAKFNPNDNERWIKEVAPEFKKKLELSATYWGQAKLDALLDKHPEVDRSYFQNETRVLLTLPEAEERFKLNSPFLPRAINVTLQGRDEELNKIKAFLNTDEKTFLIISGQGGIGKTRLMLEAGYKAVSVGWQVLWANIASMESYGGWYEAIVPERPTLLLVDEPEDEKLLRILVEQIGGSSGRANKWKVVIAVRSPKDRVLSFLNDPSIQNQCKLLPLTPIAQTSAEAFCYTLINLGKLKDQPDPWKQDAAQKLSALYDQYPMWISLAVNVLEKKGNLGDVPNKAHGLADEYLKEIYTDQQITTPEQIKKLIQWIALLGIVNREDETILEFLKEKTGLISRSVLLQIFNNLVIDRRVLVQRGARGRLVELKPDIIRDHVLQSWLVVDNGFGDNPWQPTDAARELIEILLNAVKGGSVSSIQLLILRSLARTEILLSLAEKNVSILKPFFDGLIKNASGLSVNSRIIAAGIAADIAEARPIDMINLSKTFRTNPVVDKEKKEGLFETREIGQKDVIFELAWPVFHAAIGARNESEIHAVIEELYELIKAEEIDRQGRLPNDGKRAAQLLERVIIGGPEFWSDFTAEAEKIALRFLDKVKAYTKLELGDRKALYTLCDAIITTERTQSFIQENYKFVFQRVIITPESPLWKIRTELLNKIRELLQNGVNSIELIGLLWEIIANAHTSALRILNHFSQQEVKDSLRKELLEELQWAHEVLSKRTPPPTLQELNAARKLWGWHYSFDNKQEFKNAAKALEEVYLTNDLNKEFAPLIVTGNKWDAHTEVINKKAIELINSKDPVAIKYFVDRAIEYFGESPNIYQVLNEVGIQLGKYAPEDEFIPKYVYETLKDGILTTDKPNPYLEVASVISRFWFNELRKLNKLNTIIKLLKQFKELSPNPVTKASFLQKIYEYYNPSEGSLSEDEISLLCSNYSIFLEAKKGVEFLRTIGFIFPYGDFTKYKKTVEDVIIKLPKDKTTYGIEQLCNSLYLGIEWYLKNKTAKPLPSDLNQWLLDQIMQLPDIDVVQTANWEIEQILKHTGKLSVVWLVQALQKRLEMEKQSKEGNKINSVPSLTRLSSYVKPIEATDVANKETKQAVKELLDFINDSGRLGYLLPEYAYDIDPQGLIVPNIIVDYINSVHDNDLQYKLARFAGIYEINSEGWRKIAKEVCKHANTVDDKTRYTLYNALTGSTQKIRSWSGPVGEVPGLFIKAVQDVEKFLNAEDDHDLIPFWEWYLDVAKVELKWQEEWAKEDRGE